MTCFCAREIFSSKKINRLETVLITSIYYTTTDFKKFGFSPYFWTNKKVSISYARNSVFDLASSNDLATNGGNSRIAYKIWCKCECCAPIETTILVIIIWDFLIFYQNFLSPQVKRIVIISKKHGIYELPQELSNDLKILGI